MCRVDLISKTPKGVSGILTNHLASNEHKAAVRGQQNKAATQGLHAFFSPEPAAASQGEAGGRAATASLPTRTVLVAPASLPTPFIPHSSEDEEDDADAAAVDGLIENFLSLPVRAKAAVAQRMTKHVARCKGFRPPSLHGIVDLLNHVPPAYFYTAGSYGSTYLERVARKFQLRQHNFHATGCLEFAESDSSTCAPCSAVPDSSIDGHMPYLNLPASAIPAKTNDANYSPYQMKEKKDAAREEDRRNRLNLMTLKRRVHRGRAVLNELQVLLTTSQRAQKTYALGEGALQDVTKKLEEVRELLAVEGGDLGATVSFCLEEVVRESQSALSKFCITRGDYKLRGKRKDKGEKKGKGGGGGEGDSGAAGGEEEEGGGDEDGSGAAGGEEGGGDKDGSGAAGGEEGGGDKDGSGAAGGRRGGVARVARTKRRVRVRRVRVRVRAR